MDFQELCELAQKEIQFGLADRTLMTRARIEAGGVEAHAVQIYWRQRAAGLEQEASSTASDQCIVEARRRVEIAEKRWKRQSELSAWGWAILCFAGLAGTYVFPRLAFAAHRRGTIFFYGCTMMGIVSLGTAILAWVACQRRSRPD